MGILRVDMHIYHNILLNSWNEMFHGKAVEVIKTQILG